MARTKRPPPKTNERTHGEGSIQEVSPGVFRAWRPPDEHGKRTSRRFDSHAKAHRWLVGEPEPDVLYVGAYIERWLELRAPTLRGRTVQTYQQFCGYAWDTDAALAGLPITALTTDDCQAWLNGLLETHTRYSVDVCRGIVSAAFNDAVRKGLILINPIRGTRLPNPEEQPPKAWTRDEVARLLLGARGSPHAIWLAFAIGTGLRLGELRALEWPDLDLDRMTVRVSKSIDDNTDALGPTKTGRIRIVDIPEELLPELRAHHLRQAPGNQLVFGHDGRPYNSRNYRRWLWRLCLRVGVHDAQKHTLSVHSTRHTFASISLADPECALPDVQQALGHAKLSTTLNIYGHFINHEQRRTAKATGRVLAGLVGVAEAVPVHLHRNLHRAAASTR